MELKGGRYFLIFTIPFILIASGCITDGSTPQPEETTCLECPEFVPHSIMDNMWIECGYEYESFVFYYNITDAMRVCRENGYTGDECFGLTYRICVDEAMRMNNISVHDSGDPDLRCELVQVFTDRYKDNIVCSCWFKSAPQA